MNHYSSRCLRRKIWLSLTCQSICLTAIVQVYCWKSNYLLYHRPWTAIYTSRMSSEFVEPKGEMKEFPKKSHPIKPISLDERNKHPQKIVKDIQSCGQDLDKALLILSRAYHHLIHGAPSSSSSLDTLVIDGRAISVTMDILKKLNDWTIAYTLLDKTVQSFNWNKGNKKYTQSQAKSDECSVRTVYKSFFSLASHCKRADWILYLLTIHLPLHAGLVPTIDMMHAALSAFGKCDRLDLVLEWLIKMENEDMIHAGTSDTEIPQELMERECTLHPSLSQTPQKIYKIPAPDRLAYQTASTAFGYVRRGNEAAMILRKMQRRGFIPTVQAYNQVLFAFSRASDEPDRHIEAIKILQEMEENPHVTPNDISYESVISICMRENAWEAAGEIIRRCEGSSNNDKYSSLSATLDAEETKMKKYITGMEQFIKIGTGRYGWYKLGTYEHTEYDLSISFGFQMHRNPGFNGLSFVFFNQKNMEKLGFILVRHTVLQKEESSHPSLLSDLMGMYVDDKMRGKGLANIFMSLWLKVALIAEFLPRTEVINKPLLSLVLTRFGFVPRHGHGGFEVIVSPVTRSCDDDTTSPLFSLYSPTLKHLQSVFGVRERRIQRMTISRTPPDQAGKPTFVKTYFDHPWTVLSTNQNGTNICNVSYTAETTQKKLEEAKDSLTETVDLSLPGFIDFLWNSTQLRFALFGFLDM